MTQRSFKKLSCVDLPQAPVPTPLWSPVTPVRDDSPQPQPGCPSTMIVDESGMFFGSTEEWFQYSSELVSWSWEQAHRKPQQRGSGLSTVHISEVMKCADSCMQDSLSKHSNNSLCISDMSETNSRYPSCLAEPPDTDNQALDADRRISRKPKIKSRHEKGPRKSRTKRRCIARFNIGGEGAIYSNHADGRRNPRK